MRRPGNSNWLEKGKRAGGPRKKRKTLQKKVEKIDVNVNKPRNAVVGTLSIHEPDQGEMSDVSWSPSPTQRGRSTSPGGGGKKKKDKSGSPSPDGRVRGRDREKNRSRSPKRRQTNKKVTGPADWSREELMDRIRKFGKFTVDKGSGSGTLEALNRRIMADDVVVIQEVLRRYTEVQHITFSRCFLTDDTFKLICDSMANLRHLKVLSVPFNNLSSVTVGRIISLYSYENQHRSDRRIEEIDLRNNTLSVQDGEALYRAFPTIKSLNGIKIFRHKRDTQLRDLDLSDCNLRLPEMKILDCFLHSLVPQHLANINLANNKINCKGLVVLANAIGEVGHVRTLDISNNPVTDGDLDFTGLEVLVRMLRINKHLSHLKTDHVGGFTPEQIDIMERSLAVNRCLDTEFDVEDGIHLDKFATFIRKRMEHTVQPLPAAPRMEDMDPVFEVDYAFCRLNRIPERLVDTSGIAKGQGFKMPIRYDDRKKDKRPTW